MREMSQTDDGSIFASWQASGIVRHFCCILWRHFKHDVGFLNVTVLAFCSFIDLIVRFYYCYYYVTIFVVLSPSILIFKNRLKAFIFWKVTYSYVLLVLQIYMRCVVCRFFGFLTFFFPSVLPWVWICGGFVCVCFCCVKKKSKLLMLAELARSNVFLKIYFKLWLFCS